MYRLFYVLISLYCCQVYAFDATSLYQSAVPVSNQTLEERQRVIPAAFQKVLLKVVGNSQTLNNHDLEPLTHQALELVSQFQYRRINELSDDLTRPDSLELLVSFDEANVNKALTKMGLPIWTVTRPQILVWLVYENNQQVRLLGNEDSGLPIYQTLLTAAKERGLPVLTPMMDLQDQASISAQDIIQLDLEKVKRASTRYGNKVIVLARIKQQKGRAVSASWHWIINEALSPYHSNNELTIAVNEAVDSLTNRLASQFSQVEGTEYGLKQEVTIENVKSYADYSRVMAYLSNLQNVTTVKVSSMANDALNLTIDIKGDIALFSRTLMFDHVLEAMPVVEELTQTRYRLLP